MTSQTAPVTPSESGSVRQLPTSFRIEKRGQCILISGSTPIPVLNALMSCAPADSVADAALAQALGASIAFGPTAELDVLYACEGLSKNGGCVQSGPALSAEAVSWLANGERGASSNAIFTHATGVNALGKNAPETPNSTSAFRRCQLLLEQVPEAAAAFPRIADTYPEWAPHVSVWAKVVEALDTEAHRWRTTNVEPNSNTARNLIRIANGRHPI